MLLRVPVRVRGLRRSRNTTRCSEIGGAELRFHTLIRWFRGATAAACAAPRCTDRDRDACPVRDRGQGDREPTLRRSRRSARSPCCCWSISAGRYASAWRARQPLALVGAASSAPARWPWRTHGPAATALVAFGVLFAGVVSSSRAPRPPSCSPSSSPCRAPAWPRLDRLVGGHGIGGLGRGDRGRAAGAEERSAASAGRGGHESPGRTPPRRGRARARQSRCDDRGRVRAGDRSGRCGRGRAASRLPRLPADRRARRHARWYDARRRPELAERHRAEQVDPRTGALGCFDLCGEALSRPCSNAEQTCSTDSTDLRSAVGELRGIARHDGTHRHRAATRRPDAESSHDGQVASS